MRASAGALAVHTALILAGGHVRASAGALAVHTALKGGTRWEESIINTNSKRRHKDESTLTHVDLEDFFSCCKFASLNVNTRLSGSHSPKLKVKRQNRQDNCELIESRQNQNHFFLYTNSRLKMITTRYSPIIENTHWPLNHREEQIGTEFMADAETSTTVQSCIKAAANVQFLNFLVRLLFKCGFHLRVAHMQSPGSAKPVKAVWHV